MKGEQMVLNTDNPKNSIKIMKNSRGYNWEIKKYFDMDTDDTSHVINWIEAVDKKLKNKFENINKNNQ